MRTTTRGVLWEVLAPVVRWPLYSPLRFGLILATFLGALLVAGGITGDNHKRATPPPSEVDAAQESTLPPPAPAPSAGVEDPRKRVDPGTRRKLGRLAGRFVGAYLETDRPRAEWLSHLRDMSTPALGRALKSVDLANVDLGSRVGAVDVRGVSSTAGSAVVETDRGEVTVDLAHSGTRWEVTRIVPASPNGSETA